MSYEHGMSIIESPTSVQSPVESLAGLPIVVGTAPINLATDQSYVNKPLLARSFQEAKSALGYSSDWANYTLCEFMKSHFELYAVSPVVFINVLDPAVHKTEVAAADVNLVGGKYTINQLGVVLSTLVVKNDGGSITYVKDTSYTAEFDDTGKVVITRISGGEIVSDTAALELTYDYLNPGAVDADDIIGGVDGSGNYTGLELINKVFPEFRLVPGLILAPKWSKTSTVAAVMKAKAGNVNGIFKAMAIVDVDASEAGADVYTEVAALKETNLLTDPLQIVCWPKVKNGNDTFHLSTHLAGVICQTDALNDGIPFVSPSNKSLRASAVVIDAGGEIWLDIGQANVLNGEGVVTPLNLGSGLKVWGNRTGAYPDNTDIKDNYIPIRRMFNWIANTIVLTYFESVDSPIARRRIDSIVDGINIWLNGLTAREALLGGRVEFRAEDNPTADLLDGKVKFKLYLTPPTPMEILVFDLEYDVSNLSALFA